MKQYRSGRARAGRSADQSAGRPAFGNPLFNVVGGLVVAAVVVQVYISTNYLMTPVDVSGTHMGGGMGTLAHLGLWLVAFGGILLTALFCMPGFRTAWIAAGAIPLLLGTRALWTYPDDASLSPIDRITAIGDTREN